MKTNLHHWKSLTVIFLITLFGLGNEVLAQSSIFTNPITGLGITASPYTTGQSLATGLSSTGIARGTGISSSSADNRYNATGWTTNSSLSTSDYFSLPITPASGYHINFNNFVYTGQRSGSGPNNFALRHSSSSFGTNIGTATTTGTTLSLTGASFQNITAASEFRFYGWSASGGSYSINDFTFNGSVLGTSAVSLTGFSTCVNTASTAQSFVINGTGLNPASGNITIAPSANYEVSITSATTGFLGSGSATVAYTSGSIIRTVWVRLKSNAVAGTYNSEDINVSGGGFSVANGIDVTCSGTVNANSTISLSSVAGTDNQTKCISTALTNIAYQVGGGGTGVTLTGSLPGNVSGSYNSGTKVYTISGTPNTSGTFNYTVTTTGPCTNVALSGTITVSPNASLTLTSGVGTNNQTRCINNAISDITFSVGGTGNNATVSGLPAGVTGEYDAGVFTISGTPTASGSFPYTVTATGTCGNATATGTLTINANSTISLSSVAGTDNQTKCISTALTNITYLVGGGGTGVTLTGTLPGNVSGSYNSGTKVYTISGTPNTSGTFNYTVTTTGPCTNVALSGTITVIAAATANSGTAVTTCANSGAVNITAGATSTNNNGITWTSSGTGSFTNANSLTLAEYTPSQADINAGSVTLTLTATGNSPCSNASSNKTLTIRPVPQTTGVTICQGGQAADLTVQSLCPENAPVSVGPSFTTSGSNLTGIGNTAWTNLTNGGSNNNAYVTGVLPNASSVSNYFRATGFGFSIPANAVIKGIQVTISRFSNSGGLSRIQDNDVRIVRSGAVTGDDKANLGNNWPTSEGTFSYGSSTDTWGINDLTAADINSSNFGVAISVLNATGAGISYTANIDYIQMTVTYALNGTLNWFTTPVNGSSIGSGTPFSPVGVANSGLPNTSTPGIYTFYAECSNVLGCRTATEYEILAAPAAPVSGGDQTVCTNGSPTQTLTATATGGTVTWYDQSSNGNLVSPPVQTGVGSTILYAQSFDGTCSSLTRTAVSLTILNDGTLQLGSLPGTDNQTVCINNPITNITYNIGGAATGASITAGLLPTGVTGSYNNGVFTISGTPTESGSFSYTVTASGSSCVNQSLSGSITVTANGSIQLSSSEESESQTVCISNAITDITYNIGGTATGATISAGFLPNGVTGTYDNGVFTISGTPTVSGNFSYTVTTTGSPCINPSLSGSITVTANASVGLTSSVGTDAQTVCINTAITDITYQTGGSATSAYVVGLPAGLSANYNLGVLTISGNPSESGVFGYTVFTTGPCVTPTLGGSITVTADASISLTSGTPSQSLCLGNPIGSIVYSVGGSGNNATASGLPAGVNGVYNNGTFTISGTPTVAGVFDFTVTATGPCGSASTSTATLIIASGDLPVVSGQVNVCQYVGTPAQVTYTAVAEGATSFNWVLPPHATLVSQTNNPGVGTITVTFAGPFTAHPNKQLRVRAVSACGVSPLVIYYLQAQTPSTPQPIVASTSNVCPSLGTNVAITYTIPKVAGASGYIWNAQFGTTTISHPNGLGQNDTTVTVTFTSGFTTSNITVQAFNPCGTSGGRALTITRANPATPGLISGPVNVCSNIAPNGTAAVYSVGQQPTVTAYNWTLPSGSSNISYPATNSASFIYPSGYSGGLVSVTATNGCGTSLPRNIAIATLNPATPSVIDVIQTSACPNREFTYSLSGMPANANTVNWTYPSGGTVVSQGAFSISIAYPSTSIVGTVTAQSVNNCGNSVVRSIQVLIPACPPEERIPASTSPVFSKGNDIAPVALFKAQVFPNPTVADFKLTVSSTDKKSQVTVRLLDLQGRELKRMIVMPEALKSFGNDLKAGTYLMEVIQGSDRTVQKLIKL